MKEEGAASNGSSPVKSENGKSSPVVSWLSDIPLKTQADDVKSESSSSDSEEGGNFSTLRELLIRPAPEGAETQPKKKQKKSRGDILDDVISSVVEEKKDEDGEVKPFALSNVVKRYERSGRGREELPIRIMTLTESKLLYPDVPHAWLCDGKLLHLTDPMHPGNYKPFQVIFNSDCVYNNTTSIMSIFLKSHLRHSRTDDVSNFYLFIVDRISGNVVNRF